MRIVECNGCGKEIRPDEPFYEQKNGRERYCKACNKKYETFLEKAAPIYKEIDALKIKKLEGMRKEVFGEPVYEKTSSTYREETKVSDAANKLSGGNNGK